MKKSPKARTPKSTPKPRVPLLLAAVASMIQERNDAELVEALEAARRAMREHARGEYPDSIHEFIDRYAQHAPYVKDVQAARDAAIDVDGSLHNAYATPGLLAGIALAYIVLTNEGGVR